MYKWNFTILTLQLVNATWLDPKTMFVAEEMVNVYVKQIMLEDNVMNVRKDIIATRVVMVSFDTAAIIPPLQQ